MPDRPSARNRPISKKDRSNFSLHKREASHTKKGTRSLIEIIIAKNSRSSRKRLTLPSEGLWNTTASFFLFCRLQLNGGCSDDLVTLRIQETTIDTVCGKGQARSHKGCTQELGYSLLGDPSICKALAIPKHLTGPSDPSAMTSNPTNLAPEDQFLLWHQELEARQEEQARQVVELREQANQLREENEHLRTQLEADRAG